MRNLQAWSSVFVCTVAFLLFLMLSDPRVNWSEILIVLGPVAVLWSTYVTSIVQTRRTVTSREGLLSGSSFMRWGDVISYLCIPGMLLLWSGHRRVAIRSAWIGRTGLYKIRRRLPATAEDRWSDRKAAFIYILYAWLMLCLCIVEYRRCRLGLAVLAGMQHSGLSLPAFASLGLSLMHFGLVIERGTLALTSILVSLIGWEHLLAVLSIERSVVASLSDIGLTLAVFLPLLPLAMFLFSRYQRILEEQRMYLRRDQSPSGGRRRGTT